MLRAGPIQMNKKYFGESYDLVESIWIINSLREIIVNAVTDVEFDGGNRCE